MSKWPFTKGLHDLGRGAYAYLQPSGTWGYSNAGLVTDGDQSLLVDTLFDERLTAEMLGVNKAVIIASEAAAHEMRDEGNPQMLAHLLKNAETMGEVGAFFKRIFSAFDF